MKQFNLRDLKFEGVCKGIFQFTDLTDKNVLIEYCDKWYFKPIETNNVRQEIFNAWSLVFGGEMEKLTECEVK